jgi:hypothetical protein
MRGSGDPATPYRLRRDERSLPRRGGFGALRPPTLNRVPLRADEDQVMIGRTPAAPRAAQTTTAVTRGR